MIRPDELGQIERLVEMARAQKEALENGDVEAFEHLADERDTLQVAVAEAMSAVGPERSSHDLQRVVEIDRESMAIIRRLSRTAALALAEVRRSTLGVRGYLPVLTTAGTGPSVDHAR